MLGLLVASSLTVVATIGWGLSVRRRNANVVDQLWGVSQIVVAVCCVFAGETRAARSWLTAALVVVWGLRLSAHLCFRDRGRAEDFRHREARQRHRHFPLRSLVEVFWLQLVGGGLVVGLPMFAAVRAPQPPLRWLDAVGVVLWLSGLGIESLADRQLARFRADPDRRRQVLDDGLWRNSRHPNYFGEVVLWIGIAMLGVAAGHWWSLLSPLMVLIVVLRVSGVAVMDAHLLASRGDQYEAYVQTTSALVPMPKLHRRRQ